MSLRILHIIAQLDIGGAEMLVLHLSKQMALRGIEPKVCTFKANGGLIAEFHKHNIEVKTLEKKDGVDFSLVSKIVRYIKKESIDIVHTHNYQPWFYATMAIPFSRKIKLVHTEHSALKQGQKKEIVIEKLLSFLTHQIIADCYRLSDFLTGKVGIRPGKVVTIYNGIIDIRQSISIEKSRALRHKYNISDDELIIGSIGRLVDDKNYNMLIESFRVLHARYPKTRLIIVGDGTERSVLEQQVIENGLAGTVVFTGFQTDVAAYLNIFDYFVLSSKDEGFPLALMEAMLFGIPVVCTDVGGVSELIDNRVNGLIVNSYDYISMSNALLELFNDVNLRQTISDNATKTIEKKFMLPQMVDNYIHIYKKVSGGQAV